ncbi:MAG: hypothetical protein AAF755_08280 [Pseudomonadota bacterium]
MLFLAVAAGFIFGGVTPSAAQSAKETDCRYQARVVAAVQEARLDRVRERSVAAHVAKNASWPEKYNAVIPLITPWVYETRMRDIRNKDLADAWLELCLQN